MKFRKIFFVVIISILMINTSVFAHEEILKSKTQLMNAKIKTRDYEDFFWCDSSEGETLNIYIKNNGKQSIQHRIIHGEKAMRSKGTIKPQQKVQLRLEPDRAGKWTVHVETTDGSKMDVKIEAQQWFFPESTDENNLDNIIKENKKLKEQINISNKKIENLINFLKQTNQLKQANNFIKNL